MAWHQLMVRVVVELLVAGTDALGIHHQLIASKKYQIVNGFIHKNLVISKQCKLVEELQLVG